MIRPPRNRQGNDLGSSYRSAIFYTSNEQRQIAVQTIAEIEASGLWPGKIITQIVPASDFWEAEPEHQDCLRSNAAPAAMPVISFDLNGSCLAASPRPLRACEKRAR
jgi:peptide methionine sulfoxide reductase MsrA